MISPVLSSTSAIRTAALVAAFIGGFLLLDRLVAAGLTLAYQRSTASPLRVVELLKPQAVVVGTSSAKYAILPAAWPKPMVNFAQDGQTIFYSLALADAIARQGKTPDILIGVDPFDLETGIDNPSAERVWRIAPLLAASPEWRVLLSQARPASSKMLLLRSWAFRGTIPGLFNGLLRSRAPRYIPLPAGAVIPPEFEPDHPRAFHPSVIRYATLLAATAAHSGTRLTLVVTPAFMDPRTDKPSQRALVNELARLLGANTCDLSRIENPAIAVLRDQPGNFRDGIHLTEAGARTYTGELASAFAMRCAVQPISSSPASPSR